MGNKKNNLSKFAVPSRSTVKRKKGDEDVSINERKVVLATCEL